MVRTVAELDTAVTPQTSVAVVVESHSSTDLVVPEVTAGSVLSRYSQNDHIARVGLETQDTYFLHSQKRMAHMGAARSQMKCRSIDGNGAPGS